MPLTRCASHHRNQVWCGILCEASYLSGFLMFCDSFSLGTPVFFFTEISISRQYEHSNSPEQKRWRHVDFTRMCIVGIKYK